MQRATPPDLVENFPVFVDEERVEEEAFRQGRLGSPDGLLIGGTEVGAKRKADLQEKVVG